MVWLPLPESTGEKLANFFRGPAGLVLWRLFFLATLGLILYIIVAGGPGFFVAAIASMIVSILVADDIRAAVSDLWNLDFYRWKS